MQRSQVARLASVLALTIAVVVLAVLLLSSSGSYVLHAQFTDAGQLVNGDLVTVAGHKVGTVGQIRLSSHGLADVELDIGDDSITPIHDGSVATIGQLSLTGVANRFVGLNLNSAGRAIPSGGTLPVTQTRGIVDLDVLLDALTPKVRASFQQLLRTGAYFFSKPTAQQVNAGLVYLNPAFSQTAQLAGEISADRSALGRLVSTSATVSSGLAAHSTDLSGAVTNTATTLREIAAERTALQDILTRAPGVLGQGTAVLGDVNYSLHQLDPTLRDLRPVAPPAATLLRKVVPAANNAIPTVEGIERLVPGAKSALLALPPAERQATPAIQSLTASLTGVTPILSGLRPYAPDLVGGFFNGVGGSTGASYDANGHYLKSLLAVQPGGASLTGLLGLLGSATSSIGPFSGTRYGLHSPCPGGGNPPAPDGSNPWTSPDVFSGITACNPADDQRP